MQIHTPSRPYSRNILFAAMMLLLSALLFAASPSTVTAQSACPLLGRLQAGAPVEVIDGTANNLRYGPGLGYGVMRLRMDPGVVWYVQEGPVCANGINWYRVVAYDADGWTAEGEPGQGYYLARTDLQPGEGCYSDRLAVGMRVHVGDPKPQRVRPRPSESASVSAWLYPGVPVTIVDGPRCANGWVWWYIRDDSGRIKGWTPEGDGPTIPWLVPAPAPRQTGNSSHGAASSGNNTNPVGTTTTAAQPQFTGTYHASNPATSDVVFSDNLDTMTWFQSGFKITSRPGSITQSQTETIVLPVRSGHQRYRSDTFIVGGAYCPAGSLVSVTLQIGETSKTFTCRNGNLFRDLDKQVSVTHAPDTDLVITATTHIWNFSSDSDAMISIDLIESTLYPQ